MRFAVDILHPAHVHFFRNFIGEMQSRGHDFVVTARDKECAVDLLRAYGIPVEVISEQATGAIRLIGELVGRTSRFWRLMRRFRPDFLLGIMGPTIALAGRLLPAKTVIFYDTEMATVSNWFSYPLSHVVCTPTCYQKKVIGSRHITYPGYHELSYLHPKRFTPNPEVLSAQGLDTERPIYLVRFVSWEASHDVGELGFSRAAKQDLVERLSRRGQVLISSEAPLPEALERYRFSLPVKQIHHVIAFADLLVGESATMASEAAVLGTHAIFVSKTGRGYTDEQEADYGLVHNFTDRQSSEALTMVDRLLALEDLKGDAAQRRARLLDDKIDVTAWMIELFEEGGLGARRSRGSGSLSGV